MKVKVVDNSKPYIYEEEQQASMYIIFSKHSSYILFKVDVKQSALSTEDHSLYKPEGAYRIQ